MSTADATTRDGAGWDVITELYHTRRAVDLSGNVHELEASGVLPATGNLLYTMVRTLKPKRTIETGFAFGFSTLHILQALAENGSGFHEAIDPVETQRWHGIGLANVKRAGFSPMFRHLEMLSAVALPSHLVNQERFDFAFVDGSHLFDDILLDAYYIDKLLIDGAVMVFDDWNWMPAVRAVVSFIEKNWCFRSLDVSVPNVRVLQKIRASTRPWDHFAPFEVTSYEELKMAKTPVAVR